MHEVSRTLSHPDTLHDISLCHLGELNVALPVLDVGDPIVFNTCGRRWGLHFFNLVILSFTQSPSA